MSLEIVTRIFHKITENQDIADDIQLLPLNIVTKSKADSLIAHLLNQCFKCNNIAATQCVIDTFDDARAQVDPLPAITNIFLNNSLSRDVLIFAVSCFPNKEPSGFFLDLINMGDDVSALKIAVTLSTIFPTLSHEDWRQLHKLTDDFEEEEYPNQMLRSFFQTKVAETYISFKPPEWIIFGISERTIPIYPNDIIPTVKDAVDLLLCDLKNNNIDIVNDKNKTAEITDVLITQYSISTSIEKISMLSSIKDIPLFDDKIIFQEYGPVNTVYCHTAYADHEHECEKYGGCRMLLCNEFEETNNDGDGIDVLAAEDLLLDWFRWSCDECLRKIPKRHYAIREPLNHGGWRGCYCSFECLKLRIEDRLRPVSIGRMQEQLEVIGIRDR